MIFGQIGQDKFMLTMLKISGYKSFEQLDVSNLSLINLIGGKNDVGKTSLLEALFMLHDRLNPAMIYRQSMWRGINKFSTDPKVSWAPVFKNYNIEKGIIITGIKTDHVRETLKINFNPKFNKRSMSLNSIKDQANKSSTNDQIGPALDVVFEVDGKEKQRSHITLEENNLGLHVETATLRSEIKVTFIPSRMGINPIEDSERFGRLEMAGDHNFIIEALRSIEPNLQSISTITVAGEPILFAEVGIGSRIPVPYMGDGVARVLSILLAISSSKDGMVLIDEVENGLHYSIMSKIWESIAKTAKKFNCQLFLTTHSYECLKLAVEGLKEKFEKDFTYIRFERKDRFAVAKNYSYENLVAALDQNWEVR